MKCKHQKCARFGSDGKRNICVHDGVAVCVCMGVFVCVFVMLSCLTHLKKENYGDLHT